MMIREHYFSLSHSDGGCFISFDSGLDCFLTYDDDIVAVELKPISRLLVFR